MTTLTRERLSAGDVRSRPGALWAVVLAGAATLETAGARHRVLAGDAVLVDARTAHRLVADDETDLVHGDLRPAVPSAALPSPLVVRGFDQRQRGVVALVTACPLDAISSPAPFAASYAGLVGAAMAALWHETVTPAGSAGGAAGGSAGAGAAGTGIAVATADTQVADVVAALADRPGEPWTLDRMAALVHLSRSALTERFRRATGHSPMQMLREVRMHRARTLLIDRCLPVTRVAFEVGYGSVAAFSRAFTSDHGLSPLAWRAGPDQAASSAAWTGPNTNQAQLSARTRTPTRPRQARPWVPSAPLGPSGAGYPQERPAESRRDRGGRPDQHQRPDAVPVQ
ncbi:AraC family transcriptional regulator [Promicromonospora sp. MEB111]|uniref:AraC family transcriptional regulator n=1 Tax=Promicromonospora sp. MEB111 TaxID=3040301 RepID=UPI00254B6490|nr:AraC family transcriptional regulator [Promicromonospora sp. MEB111]